MPLMESPLRMRSCYYTSSWPWVRSPSQAAPAASVGALQAVHKLDKKVIIAGRRQRPPRSNYCSQSRHDWLSTRRSEATAIDAFAACVREKIPELNVLVNDAGISRPETLTDDSDLSVARNIIETNIEGVLHMTAALKRSILAASATSR